MSTPELYAACFLGTTGFLLLGILYFGIKSFTQRNKIGLRHNYKEVDDLYITASVFGYMLGAFTFALVIIAASISRFF